MKFDYSKVGSFLRPIVTVTLVNQEAKIEYDLLIDSGADVSIVHADLAEILAITHAISACAQKL